MGLDKRDKVHAIEFLALLAFIARERQRLTREVVPRAQFTHNDLAMAYAFQNQFGPPPPGGLLKPFHQSLSHMSMGQQLDQSFPPPTTMVPRSTSATESPLAHYQPSAVLGMVRNGGGVEEYLPIQQGARFGSPTQHNQAMPTNSGGVVTSPSMNQGIPQSLERTQPTWRDSGQVP